MMIRQGYELGCADEFWRGPDHVSFWLQRYGENGRRQIPKSIEWADSSEFETREPTFDLPKERAQALMDMLWSAGIRPVAGRQSEGVTAAQGRHLEDMRALAFTKLGVERPNG